MVTLTEVEDEHFQANQPGPEVDDDDYSDTGMPNPQFSSMDLPN
jgi:hypothetical protein